ncbi:MAG: DUF5053 domain-containing protein [Alistipes sp.]|nr:DUF5053 domain-containing protein [Alistipes sp.]
MKARLEKLKERFVNAKTDAARNAIMEEIRALCDADASGVAEAALESIKETNAAAEEIVLRDRLKDILPAVSLAYIAQNYFNKTRQWLYQRVNGSCVNGKPAKFTKEELRILDVALKDIGNRLSSVDVSA